MALTNGAALCLASQEVLSSGNALLELLREQRITTVTLPPSLLVHLSPGDLPDLRTVIAAGERCPPEIVARWAPGRRFFNAYGPTETTVCASIYLCKAEIAQHRNIPIGHPIANFQLHIVDAHLRVVPDGVPGELLIGGIGLANGYLHNPALTAEKFVPNSFISDRLEQRMRSTRLYRSGDLVRRLPDGNLEFIGRIDHQVKLRGFRIELGEIENTLSQHPAVHAAFVMEKSASPEHKRLVAYIVVSPEEPPSVTVLCSFLKEKLPNYMLPGAFVVLDELPLTANGKVDRQRLPSPTAAQAKLAEPYVAPRSELEWQVASLWQKALGTQSVGINDNFFDLGGHSLLLLQLQSQLEEITSKTIPLVEMFRHVTVAELASYLSGQREELNVTSSQDRAKRRRDAVEQQVRSRRQRRMARSDAE